MKQSSRTEIITALAEIEEDQTEAEDLAAFEDEEWQEYLEYDEPEYDEPYDYGYDWFDYESDVEDYYYY